ncbi:hypothetical protein GOV05_02940 [Candidatus Woesearchaeota archaeon]|nr:hypothetical protein [Candidatus Woesearchaeota archaeon]
MQVFYGFKLDSPWGSHQGLKSDYVDELSNCIRREKRREVGLVKYLKDKKSIGETSREKAVRKLEWILKTNNVGFLPYEGRDHLVSINNPERDKELAKSNIEKAKNMMDEEFRSYNSTTNIRLMSELLTLPK